ncbi:MAG: murein biosynthesis integral membrane protein MurJ [Rhodobacteraceae bacterium]|nr:murein biosynthesis integral membrane protein MurJ [Paracoccaceae bacterium]
MTRQIRLVSGFLTVGVWTLLSKVLGFVRDVMIASALGSGPSAQALLVAFALPNMFRRFFAEGAFSTAFVPMFSKKIESGEGAEDFAREAFSGLATIVLALTLIAQVFMPFLVWAMASGFAGDERFDMTVDFGRIVFPYILFISLAALLSGVLNAMGRFAVAAAAPVFLNIILISAMVFAQIWGFDIAKSIIWAMPFAGVVQMGIVWFAAKSAGIHIIPRRPRLSPEMKRLAIIAAPAALAGGVVQINLLVGRQVASYFDGAVAWLSYADRLYQLPLGVVGIAIGVVLLPDLSRKLRAGDAAGGAHSLNRAAEFSMMLTVPAAAALIVIPLPLVSVLFGRGAFTTEDAIATALAVAIYGAGLPAFVLAKVVAPLFFAREDTRRPFHYALISMVINVVIAIGLSPWFGFLAAAIGTSVAAWIMLAQLVLGSRKLDGAPTLDARLKRIIPKILIASAVMAATLYFAAVGLNTYLETPTVRYVALAGLVISGVVVYAGVILASGAMRAGDLRKLLRR